MKSIKMIGALLVTAAAFAFSLTGCAGGGGGTKTFIMEAEYIDLDGLFGSGISSDQHGVEMIYGDGTEAQKNLGWSEGYYVGFTYASNLKFDFVFQSDRAATATIVVRLGSELGELNLDPTTFEVALNGTPISYQSLSVGNSEMASMKFYDKTVTTNAELKEGENLISLTILPNTFCNGAKTGGPCIDCVKLTSKADLSWNPKTDNPSLRGQI